jgi:hypothetical protein
MASLHLGDSRYTGQTVYALITNQDGQHHSTAGGGSFATYDGANYSTYVITMTEQSNGGKNGHFTGDVPVTVAAGAYYVEYRVRAGTSPSFTDEIIKLERFVWDGTVEVTLANVVENALTAARAEPTTAPAANASLVSKIGYLFAALRNKVNVEGDEKRFYRSASNTVLFSKTLADDGTIYSESDAA